MGDVKKLQRDIMWAFDNKQEIPTDVLQVAEEMFNGLEEKYEQLGCNNSEIKEYMQDNLEKLIIELQSGVGNRRKDEQFEGIQNFISFAEHQENQEEVSSKIELVSNNKANNIRITLNTIDQIEGALRNVQEKQKEFLKKNRKFTGNQINEINTQALAHISYLRNQNENKVYNCFQLENLELKDELLQAYKEYKGN